MAVLLFIRKFNSVHFNGRFDNLTTLFLLKKKTHECIQHIVELYKERKYVDSSDFNGNAHECLQAILIRNSIECDINHDRTKFSEKLSNQCNNER